MFHGGSGEENKDMEQRVRNASQRRDMLHRYTLEDFTMAVVTAVDDRR